MCSAYEDSSESLDRLSPPIGLKAARRGSEALIPVIVEETVGEDTLSSKRKSDDVRKRKGKNIEKELEIFDVTDQNKIRKALEETAVTKQFLSVQKEKGKGKQGREKEEKEKEGGEGHRYLSLSRLSFRSEDEKQKEKETEEKEEGKEKGGGGGEGKGKTTAESDAGGYNTGEDASLLKESSANEKEKEVDIKGSYDTKISDSGSEKGNYDTKLSNSDSQKGTYDTNLSNSDSEKGKVIGSYNTNLSQSTSEKGNERGGTYDTKLSDSDSEKAEKGKLKASSSDKLSKSGKQVLTFDNPQREEKLRLYGAEVSDSSSSSSSSANEKGGEGKAKGKDKDKVKVKEKERMKVKEKNKEREEKEKKEEGKERMESLNKDYQLKKKISESKHTNPYDSKDNSQPPTSADTASSSLTSTPIPSDPLKQNLRKNKSEKGSEKPTAGAKAPEGVSAETVLGLINTDHDTKLRSYIARGDESSSEKEGEGKEKGGKGKRERKKAEGGEGEGGGGERGGE